jgi:hypothetical protein
MLLIFVWEPFFLYLILGGAFVIWGLVEAFMTVIVLGIVIALLPPLTFVYYIIVEAEDAVDRRKYRKAKMRATQQYQPDPMQLPHPQYPPTSHQYAHPQPHHQQPQSTRSWWDQWRRTPPPVRHNITHCPECKGRVFAGRAYCPHCSSPIPGAHLGGQPQDGDVWAKI